LAVFSGVEEGQTTGILIQAKVVGRETRGDTTAALHKWVFSNFDWGVSNFKGNGRNGRWQMHSPDAGMQQGRRWSGDGLGLVGGERGGGLGEEKRERRGCVKEQIEEQGLNLRRS